MAIEVSGDVGYVALVVIAAFITHMWMAGRVLTARKKYNVHYPTMYALESETKEAKVFNCIQRGHQNFLEVVSFFLSLILFAGLQHPKLAALFGIIFLAARILYLIDYSSGIPAKRMRATGLTYLAMVGLMGCTTSFAVHQLFL